MGLKDVQQKNAEEKRKRYSELAAMVKDNRIEYIIRVILKEVRKERRLITQVLYTLFSAYTADPLNLAINAPSGEGKSYVLNNVIKYFPVLDILLLAGMTEKAIFHRKGDIVVPEDEGVYVGIDKYTDDIELQMDDLNDELKEASGSAKSEVRAKIQALEKELEEVKDQAIKRIELTNKILIFQDTPKPELLEAIMPLLSHDQFRVFYEFPSKNANGIQTTTNMLEGFPTVIYSQAIEGSNRERFPEILRRFIFANPEMNEEKYKEAIDQMYKASLPEKIYQTSVVSEEEKEIVKGLVMEIIQEIKLHCVDQSSNKVFMPFMDALVSSFRSTSAFDMSVASKTQKFLTLLPIVNIKERPCLLTDDQQRIPFCTYKDLEDATFLNEFVYGGIRQYILKWYLQVLLAIWVEKERKGPDGLDAETINGKVLMEKKPVVRMNELIHRTKEITGTVDSMTQNQIRVKYLNSLIYSGYIDEFSSEIHPKEKVFYPSAMDILHKYEIEGKDLRMVQKIKVTDENKYPSPRILANSIRSMMSAYPNSHIIDYNGAELTVDQLIEKYYSNTTKLFTLGEEKSPDDIKKLLLANTPHNSSLVDYTQKILDEIICDDCGEKILMSDENSHKQTCSGR